MLTVFRYVAIMLSALALALGLTHALAVTPDPRLAAFSVALQVMATLCAIVVTTRMRPGSWLAFAGTSMLLVATLIWATSLRPVLVSGGVKLPAWATSPAVQQAADLVPGGNLDLAALSIWFVGMSFLLLSAIRQPVFRGARVQLPRARGPLPRGDGSLPLIR